MGLPKRPKPKNFRNCKHGGHMINKLINCHVTYHPPCLYSKSSDLKASIENDNLNNKLISNHVAVIFIF